MIAVALAVSVVAALAAAWITGAIRGHATRTGVLDHPNERSLHATATPRGGGIAIVVVTLTAEALLVAAGVLPWRVGLGWIACGAAIAAVGWTDDRVGLGIGVRLAFQMLAAVVLVAIASGAGEPAASAWLAALALVLSVGGVVWLINLYNFMDGIDGIAATEGLLAAAFGAILALRAGDGAVALAAAALAGGCGGFLRWNWHPARIFMGDVGSCFIGFQFAAFALLGDGHARFVWAILLAPFVTDTSLTLLRRLITGRAWFRPHKTHAYQLLQRAGPRPHSRVTLALATYIIVALWPLAWLASARPHTAALATLAAYALTGMIWAGVILRYRVLLEEKPSS